MTSSPGILQIHNARPEYKDGIAEIRIEGHTSSEWFDTVGLDMAYYNNMKLSQDRSRNVLKYALEIRDILK